jgi:hypothetical protein
LLQHGSGGASACGVREGRTGLTNALAHGEEAGRVDRKVAVVRLRKITQHGELWGAASHLDGGRWRGGVEVRVERERDEPFGGLTRKNVMPALLLVLLSAHIFLNS